MKITVLAENTAVSDGFIAEHGLSLYIETQNHTVLFDMGQTDAFCKNAEKLGIDLEKVDFAVLSHGHYDHGGGLRKFLQINKKAPVYLSENAFGDYYNASGKYIGLDKALQSSERLVFVKDELIIDGGVSLYSCNKKDRPFATDPYGLGKGANGGIIPDDFLHEQYLLINENGRRVLVSGCSHKGVLNIAQWFAPDVFIGGFHLSKNEVSGEGAQRLTLTAGELMRNSADYFTAHCTGTEQYEFLRGIMGERLSYLSTGVSVKI